MEETSQSKTSILEVAWIRYAQYDAASYKKKRIQYRLHRWAAIVSIFATLFVILSAIYPETAPAEGKLAINIILILLPILGSVMAAFVNKFYPGTEWLVLRAGAEQIMKEIYQFRTILQKTDKRRRNWLENRLREIQLQVYNGLNGEMAIEPYHGKTPPPYDDGSLRTDGGYNDLTADEYYTLRLKEQLDWHVKRVNSAQKERIRLQIWILLVGAAGAFLAALGGILGGSISLWVAFTTALTTALIGWQELKNLDMIVRNYSKAVLDLSSVSDHWKQLDEDERTKKEFYRMVNDTENILWNINMEYVKFMQQTFESAKLEEEDFVDQTLRSAGVDKPASTQSPAASSANNGGAG